MIIKIGYTDPNLRQRDNVFNSTSCDTAAKALANRPKKDSYVNTVDINIDRYNLRGEYTDRSLETIARDIPSDGSPTIHIVSHGQHLGLGEFGERIFGDRVIKPEDLVDMLLPSIKDNDNLTKIKFKACFSGVVYPGDTTSYAEKFAMILSGRMKQEGVPRSRVIEVEGINGIVYVDKKTHVMSPEMETEFLSCNRQLKFLTKMEVDKCHYKPKFIAVPTHCGWLR